MRKRGTTALDAPIAFTRRLDAPPADVFAFLEDLRNHVSLAPSSAEVLSLEAGPHGLGHAVVRLTGPLAIRRTAHTELVRLEAPSLIAGQARVGEHTEASVTWRIDDDGGGASVVTLTARVEKAGALERLVLALGGRRWITRRFAAALEELAAELSRDRARMAPRATGRPAHFRAEGVAHSRSRA
jgi:hypothetical protein